MKPDFIENKNSLRLFSTHCKQELILVPSSFKEVKISLELMADRFFVSYTHFLIYPFKDLQNLIKI